MRRIRDIDLMQLHDGELDAEERRELEAALAADPAAARQAAAKRAGLDEVGELVRTDAETAADRVEARMARMWGEIDKQIDLGKQPAREEAPARPAAPGLWSRFSRWMEGYRGHVLTGVLSAGAVAAIAFVLRPAPHVGPTTAPAVATHEPVKQPEVVPVNLPSDPASVDGVDAPDGTSTVFTYETDD